MRRTLIASAIFCLLTPMVQAQTLTEPVLPPARIVLNDATMQAIVLQDVRMQTQVFADHARTIVTVVLKNPNARQLEGNFEFPLLPEQHVSGFALDINGKLRAASSVPKARAEEVFEEIRRTKTDPGLLEKNAGNVYRLRVYPIPANGTRTVQITIDQLLTSDNDVYALRLPMSFSSRIQNFTLDVQSAYKVTATHGLLNAQSTAKGLSFSATNYNTKDWLAFNIERKNTEQWHIETRDNQRYALAQLPIDTTKIAIDAPRVLPRNIDIFWDASTSANDTQTARAIAAMDAYLSYLLNQSVAPNITVHLVRNRVETLDTIRLTRKNLSSLLDLLQKAPYDGATRLDALTPKTNSDLVILVSDGLATYGPTKLAIAGNAPVYSLNTGISSNTLALTRLADNRRGAFIDLTHGMSADAVRSAVSALTQQHASIKRLSSASATDFITPQYTLTSNTFNLAARLIESSGTVDIELEDALGATHHLSYAIPATTSGGTMAAQQWAQWQLDALSTDLSSNRKRMEKLSSDYGLVTDASSLLVLETAADYARYDITPPAELAAEVAQIKQNDGQSKQADQKAHLDGVVNEFDEKLKWWKKDFPKTPPKPKPSAKTKGGSNVTLYGMVDSGLGALADSAAPPAPAHTAVRREESRSSGSHLGISGDEDTGTGLSANSGDTSIQLKKWEPNEPYIARFKAAADADLYKIYLDERTAYRSSTAFYLDVADIFFDRKQPELALRILSNLAEMNLDNRHVLRILSYRLLQAKQPQDAIPFLTRVAELSPNEPQSWRDLGLAYAATGASQEAIKNLWKVVSQPWHGRFPGVEQIALNELNAIAASSVQTVDTSFVDARLRKNLPVDLRVVLAWDADDTDIDLWVTDPNDEKVYYSHKLSYQGGRISNDFRGGYGPEEFLLKDAKPGKYKVEAKFYGHRQQVITPATSLMMKLTTQFGRKNQKDESVILRLSGQAEEVFVGEFTVK